MHPGSLVSEPRLYTQPNSAEDRSPMDMGGVDEVREMEETYASQQKETRPQNLYPGSIRDDQQQRAMSFFPVSQLWVWLLTSQLFPLQHQLQASPSRSCLCVDWGSWGERDLPVESSPRSDSLNWSLGVSCWGQPPTGCIQPKLARQFSLP